MSNCGRCGREEEKPLEFLECDSCGGSFCSDCLREIPPKEVADYDIFLSPDVVADVTDLATEEGVPVMFSICTGCHPGFCGGDQDDAG